MIKIGLWTGRHRDGVIQRDEDEDEGWRCVGRGYVPSTLISTTTLSSSVMICVLLLWLVVVKAVIMSGVALGAS